MRNLAVDSLAVYSTTVQLALIFIESLVNIQNAVFAIGND
jgi:hypothetical protein